MIESNKVEITFGPVDSPILNDKLQPGYEFTEVEGVIDIERRNIEVKDKFGNTMLNFGDHVGIFKRENGGSNFANIENTLAKLNGYHVKVKIEIVSLPKST